MMKLLLCVLPFGVLSGLVAAQANADDSTASRADYAPKPATTKVAKPATRAHDPRGVKFSNPYGPPEGSAQPKAPELPTTQRAAAADPKGRVSFTYKWKASNDPVDAYWHVRSAPGSDAPGDTFMGGLKLGF
jgi:hypothetical protein